MQRLYDVIYAGGTHVVIGHPMRKADEKLELYNPVIVATFKVLKEAELFASESNLELSKKDAVEEIKRVIEQKKPWHHKVKSLFRRNK